MPGLGLRRNADFSLRKDYRRPLPFLYQSTWVETRFTNLLDPDPRSRAVFASTPLKCLRRSVRDVPVLTR
jgi:hypothetical protein